MLLPKVITVYLTGFGPFQGVTDNPSGKISGSFLPALSTVLDFTSASGTKYQIRLHPHTEPVKVAYATVDNLIPRLWNNRTWDYILHMGVGGQSGYTLETVAHDSGYYIKDVDGRVPAEALDEAQLGNGPEPRDLLDENGNEIPRPMGQGEQFTTGLNVPNLVRYVTDNGRTIETRQPISIWQSWNAGMYLCEYIFRTSLKEALKRSPEDAKRVLFMHVPYEGYPYGIPTGKEAVKALVKAMVEDGEERN